MDRSGLISDFEAYCQSLLGNPDMAAYDGLP